MQPPNLACVCLAAGLAVLGWLFGAIGALCGVALAPALLRVPDLVRERRRRAA